jgi:hypothetical protein
MAEMHFLKLTVGYAVSCEMEREVEVTERNCSLLTSQAESRLMKQLT